MPSLVHKRYDGMGWYVSGRICPSGTSDDLNGTTITPAHLAILHPDRAYDIVRVADAPQRRHIPHVYDRAQSQRARASGEARRREEERIP